MIELLIAAGIPSAIFSAIIGFIVWYFQRKITKRDAEREEREKNVEKLMLMMINSSRATNVLATATARAVQRIPEAQCNGDMTAALAEADALIKEERKFLADQGLKHIFEEK